MTDLISFSAFYERDFYPRFFYGRAATGSGRYFIMRAATLCFTACLLALSAGPLAQHARGLDGPSAKAMAGNGTRYFLSLGDILGDLPVDAFLKETRQAGKTTSGVIDVCYSVSPSSDRKDRFIVDLTADGAKLSGTGESVVDKSPVTVNLTRKETDKNITFEGKITVGSKVSLVSSTDNSASDEKEFQQSQATDDNITEKPSDFTEVSPQALAVKVKRASFTDLVKSLKSDNVQIALDSIAADCVALRSGSQILRLFVDPQRSDALVAKLKSAPGVTAAGWTTGSYDIDRAIRVAAADWRSGDRLDRDKLATAIANAAARAFSAKPASNSWNDTTGELTVTLKRPNTTAPAFDLTDTLEISALIGPEKPGAADRLIIWLGSLSTTTRDESEGPHLQFADSATNEEDSSFTDDDQVVRALAADIKGQRWDSDKSSWK